MTRPLELAQTHRLAPVLPRPSQNEEGPMASVILDVVSHQPGDREICAFFVFMEGFRKDYKEKHPNVKQVAVIGKADGEKWKSLTDAGNTCSEIEHDQVLVAEFRGGRRTEQVRGLVEEHLAAASMSSLHLLSMTASPCCVDLIPALQEVEGRRDWGIGEMEGNLSMVRVDKAAKDEFCDPHDLTQPVFIYHTCADQRVSSSQGYQGPNGV